MDFFSILQLLGGLAFFFYGMNSMSSGLESMAGGALERALKKMTSNRVKGFALGAGTTAIIQSSSAVTVMLVGFVSSGIMTLRQTIGVIMGSNVGTTVTAWILSLVGIESDNPWMKLLKPENFSLIFAFVGILLIMISKSQKKKDIGTILIGFAVLMFGMEMMSGAVEPLKDIPEFKSVLTAFNNPIFGVFIGALVTAIIQSSSASVGILQALALTGGITYGMAIPIIMGQNIGTCITAIISSVGASREAKKVGVVHVSFNLIGTAIFLSAYCIVDAVVGLAITTMPIDAVGIAIVHTLFNVSTSLLLLPCAGLLEKIANFVYKDTDKKEKKELLSERLLATPSVALAECESVSSVMALTAQKTIQKAISAMDNYSEAVHQEILQIENTIDKYEDEIGTFLVKLSTNKISEHDSQVSSLILHSIGDFERLGDHAVNLIAVSKELHDKKYAFSEQAVQEIHILKNAVTEILNLATEAYVNRDIEMAERVEPLEQVIDELVAGIKNKHIERLQTGNCSIEMGFILSDLLTNYERISDHCSNIAISVIEINNNSHDAHKYLKHVKFSSDEYKDSYEQYKLKYDI
ncbi:MAG: Na/Pi cotransporter family protein [Clostridia bacterium]|nr:Na/Pi cotransporter family protein [Clostridia bacterium]